MLLARDRLPPPLYAASHKPDYALILAWNFAEPIMKKHQPIREAGGRFIIPLPTVRVS